MKRLIVGCGYLGRRVAKLWQAGGDDVFVMTRSAQRADRFGQEGLTPIIGDVLDPVTLAELPQADTVLFAVGYDRTCGASIHDVYAGGLGCTLDALGEASGPIIYISSTGVYAQDDGSWVDEDSICEPRREGGKACLAAERLLAAHPRGAGSTILRLAGIYGPDRIPRAADLAAGRSLPAPADGYLNLIHVDDAARIVVAAAGSTGTSRLYTVSDGAPTTRREYFAEVARRLNAPPPCFEAAADSAPRRARGASSKRIKNDRMLSELGVKLDYPSYREGLAAIFAEA